MNVIQSVCPYCNILKNTPVSELEHVIPEGLGSPILSLEVCNECNRLVSELFDGYYLRNSVIRILTVVTGTRTKRGQLKPFSISAEFNKPNKNKKLKISYRDFSYEGSMSEKSERKLINKYGESNFTAVTANLKKDICRYEHAKMFLGILSMIVPHFTSSETACTLRSIMWHNCHPDLGFNESTKVNGNLIGDVVRDVMDTDGPKIYSDRRHIISVKGNLDGSIHAYIDLFNNLRPNIMTVEKKEEWKDINITIIIDPEIKKIVKVSGVEVIDLTSRFSKYENGCTLKPLIT